MAWALLLFGCLLLPSWWLVGRASERCVHLQVATVGVATHAVLLVLVANGKLAQVAASGGLASRSRVSAFREVANAIRAYTR